MLFSYYSGMATYNLTVDASKVNHYLSLNGDGFQGKDNELEQVSIPLDWLIFQDEDQFKKEFATLLTKYGLLDHYQDLLCITLCSFDKVWTEIQHHYDNYDSQHRARELAQLLLFLKETPSHKLDIVTFKSHKGGAKITDLNLANWISETLIEAIEKGKFPLGKFGINVMQMLSDQLPPNENKPIDLDKLSIVKNKRIENWKKHIKSGRFIICLPVYLYLQHETELKAAQGVNFSDAQLNFLFDLLQLLKQIDADKIDSLPKDYMRSGMINLLGLQQPVLQ